MYGPLFLVLLALAAGLLYTTIYRDRATVFSSAFAGLLWALLALQSELVLASGGETVTLALETPVRYVLFSLAVLSWLLTVAAALGYYDTAPEMPPEDPIQ